MNPMILRVQAAQAAVDKYAGQPFAWYDADCARVAAFVLRELGYKPGFSRFGHYKTALGARKALKRNGFADTVDWIDSIHGLSRIPYLMTLPGDLVAGPGDEGMTALTVALSNRRLLAFHPETGGCTVVHPLQTPEICWRVAPCRS